MESYWVELAAAPILGGIVGFGVWFIQSRIDRLRREQEKLHDERRKVYSEVLEPFIRIFAGIKEPQIQQQAIKHMQSLDYKRTAFMFTLLGDDNVVHSFNKLMTHVYSLESAESNDKDRSMILVLWGDFLLEIRRNVGNRNTSLTAIDMLRSQIKDIQNLQ